MSQASAAARAAILARIGQALRPGGQTAASTDPASGQAAAVTARLQQRPVSTQAGARLVGPDERCAALILNLEAAQMTVSHLASLDEVPAAVADYLETRSITGEVTIAPALATLDWPAGYRLGAATGEETTAVTPCLAGVAETGSLVTVSSAGTPATLNFLPENHLIVLQQSQIVSHIEDVWPQLRELPVMPRAATLVTGPSRTADIEQTLEIGAHGPRRVHVLLVAATA